MNTSRFLIALAVILCLVLSPVIVLMPANIAQAQPANSPWPMFGQNPQRNARSPYSGPEVPKLKWNFTTGGQVLSSPAIGITASLSILAHEIPQEVGDFAILLSSGFSKRKALLWNVLSSVSTIPGALLAYYALGVVHAAIPNAMALSAASFLYIALADLTPELHHDLSFRHALTQFLLLLAGMVTIVLLLQLHP